MKAPEFWNKKNLISWALFPFGCIYALITALRLKLHNPTKVSIPVICIGNLTAGGSGKTPTAISISEILKKCGKTPCFISRGYGGNLQNIEVNPSIHTAFETGDEPLLLAKHAKVIVNHRRDQAANMAVSLGADIIIMDDGFQNPYLYKDKSFLVIDGTSGLGNELPIPAGPLREFYSSGIKRADAIIILGDDIHHISARPLNIPIFKGKIVPQKPPRTDKPVIAFAGIGRPDKFYQSLQDCGFNLIKTHSFPDHHFYTTAELQNIINEAQELDALIYTTTKDMIKIPVALQSQFNVLDIKIAWEDEHELQKFLLKL